MSEDWKTFLALEEELCAQLNQIDFLAHPSVVAHVYNPIDYASQLHLSFLSCFFSMPKKVLFVGMNPGPFGMAQTGVPFGDIVTVRDWLRLKGSVKVPHNTNSRIPVLGLNCTRIEVSGARFWGLFWKNMKLSPGQFFKNCFVLNVCPLLFLDKKGKNIALANLNASVRHQVEYLCDSFLADAVGLLNPEVIVAVGQYATIRARKAALIAKNMNRNVDSKEGVTNNDREDTNSMKEFQILPSSIHSSTPPLHSIISPAEVKTDANDSSSPTSHSLFLKAQIPSTYYRNPHPFHNISLIFTPACQSSTHSEFASSKCLKAESNCLDAFKQNTDKQGSSTVDATSNYPKICTLMHPSPANPAANKGWDVIALKHLEEFGVLKYFESK